MVEKGTSNVVVFLGFGRQFVTEPYFFVISFNKFEKLFAQRWFVNIFLRTVRIFASGAVVLDESLNLTAFQCLIFVLCCYVSSASSALEQTTEGKGL